MLPPNVVSSFQSIDLSPRFSKQHKLLLSGGIAASITSSVYNSLDCLRVRWQTLAHEPKFQRFTSRGIVFFARYIIQKEGFVTGLCRPGMFTSLVAGGCSAGLRFGFYEHIRDSMYSSQEEKSGVHMFLAGFACGGISYFLTTPLQVMKTKIQANQNNALYFNTCANDLPSVVRKQKFLNLWRGSSTVATRGALFSAGQMFGYDGFKTFCKSNDIIEDGVQLHIASSIVAAFCSSALSTPVDVVFARYVTSPSKSISIMKCVKIIYREEGVIGFWKGCELAFIRLSPVILTYSLLYEQMRKQFGLGYLT